MRFGGDNLHLLEGLPATFQVNQTSRRKIQASQNGPKLSQSVGTIQVCPARSMSGLDHLKFLKKSPNFVGRILTCEGMFPQNLKSIRIRMKKIRPKQDLAKIEQTEA